MTTNPTHTNLMSGLSTYGGTKRSAKGASISRGRVRIEIELEDVYEARLRYSVSVFCNGFDAFRKNVISIDDFTGSLPKFASILPRECIANVVLGVSDPNDIKNFEAAQYISGATFKPGAKFIPLGKDTATPENFLLLIDHMVSSLDCGEGLFGLTLSNGPLFLDFGSTTYFYNTVFSGVLCSKDSKEIFDQVTTTNFLKKVRVKNGPVVENDVEKLAQLASQVLSK